MKTQGLLRQTITKPHSAGDWAVSRQARRRRHSHSMSSRCNTADGRPAARPQGAPPLSRLFVPLLGKGRPFPAQGASIQNSGGTLNEALLSFVLVKLALILLLASQAVNSENLLQVYQEALRADPALAAAEAAYQATLQTKPQARAGLLPQINASAGYNYTDQSYKDAAVFFRDDHFTTKNYGLRLDQTLFNKTIWVQLDQADSSIAKSAAELTAARQDLMIRVAQAYFDVLTAQDSLEFVTAEKNAIHQQLKQSQQQFEVGLIAITDVHESQAQYDLSIAQEIDAKNQLDISKEALHTIINRHTLGLSSLNDASPLPRPEPENIQQWVETSLETNPQLKAIGYAVKLAEQEIDKRKGGHYPTLGLAATYGVNDSDGGFSSGEVTDGTVGLELKLPIFTGGLTTAQVSEARSLYEKALKEQERVKRSTVQQVRASYLNVLAGISRVSALKQALKSTQTAADAAQVGFEVGTRTAVDVLLALRETYRAQRDYSKARYDYILSTLRLKQAAGSISENDLKIINSWLQ